MINLNRLTLNEEVEQRMQKLKILGAVVCILFGGTFLGMGGSLVMAQTYDFTWTCDDTMETGNVDDTVEFEMVLTNTGTETDNYQITLTKNPSTPDEWNWELCAGGECNWGMTETVAYLEPGWIDEQFLHVALNVSGTGSFTMTVENSGKSGTKRIEYKTLVVRSNVQAPATSRWGMMILVLFILTSGLYLIRRKFALARQSSK
jgi:hypothetical protein